MRFQVFNLTEGHIRLLRRVYISSHVDRSGYAYIGLSPKRPFGNSDIESDIAEILGEVPEGSTDDDGISDELRGKMRNVLIVEVPIALQVVLSSGSFEPGEYERSGFGGEWKRTEQKQPFDHGKAIDAFYERKRQDMKRESEKLAKMIADGASTEEIQKQSDRVVSAGYTGD
jgi:hypothetical protein